jgi:hypothetical protein
VETGSAFGKLSWTFLVQHRFHLPRKWALQPEIREEDDHLIQFSRDSFAWEDVWQRGTACFGLANEERRAADQRAIVNLSHEEVRDVSTTDKAEPPIL